MLPQQKRLRAQEVREILKRGRSARGSFLSAKYLPEGEALRCAAVVSKKVAKSAVARNRLRRALYGSLAALPRSRAGAQVVFFVQKIPPAPLATAFRDDATLVVQKIMNAHV